MQPLFERLIATLNARGPKDPEVDQLIAQIAKEQGEQARTDAVGLRNGWWRSLSTTPPATAPTAPTPAATGSTPAPVPAIPPAPAPPAQAPESSLMIPLLSWKSVVGILALLGIGGGAGANFSDIPVTQWVTQTLGSERVFHTFANQRDFVVAVAFLGVVVGLAYTYFRDRTLVAPRFQADLNSHTLVISKMGFLNEVLGAVIVALLTTWAAVPPGENGTVPVKIGTIISAVVAAWVGARMQGAVLGGDFLRRVLGIVADKYPISEAERNKLRELQLPDAVAMLTQRPVAGFVATPPTPKVN